MKNVYVNIIIMVQVAGSVFFGNYSFRSGNCFTALSSAINTGGDVGVSYV